MDRRNFLTSSATSLAAVAVLATVPLTMTGCNTDWIATAIKDLPTIETILDSVLAIAADATGNGILDTVAQSGLNGAIGIAAAGLTALQSTLASYEASPTGTLLQDIDSGLVAAQANLSAILSAVQIKDAALQATISGAINLAITVVTSVELLLPSSTASAKLKAAGLPAPTVKLLNPSEITSEFNVLVTTNGYGKHRIHRKFFGL